MLDLSVSAVAFVETSVRVQQVNRAALGDLARVELGGLGGLLLSGRFESAILGSVERILMVDLEVGARVLVHLGAVHSLHLDRLRDFRLAQPLVHHVLIDVHEAALAPKSRVVVVLSRAEVVLAHGRAIGCLLPAGGFGDVGAGVVESQLIEVGALAVASSVQRPHPPTILRDVRVAARAIIRVNDRLGVNVGQLLRGPLCLNHERTYTQTRTVSY